MGEGNHDRRRKIRKNPEFSKEIHLLFIKIRQLKFNLKKKKF